MSAAAVDVGVVVDSRDKWALDVVLSCATTSFPQHRANVMEARKYLAARLASMPLDAERYRALRSVPTIALGDPGVPCIAVPRTPDGLSGDYLNEAEADAAVDAYIAGQQKVDAVQPGRAP